MKFTTDFPRAIEEQPDVGIVMEDGTRLSARIWKPVDAEADPVPAILEFLPYRKRDGTTYRDALTHPWFAGHGYAGVRVDMRGSGDSQGRPEDEYSDGEWADALAVIGWLAAQPWCNGSVGMMGISWGGFNSLQLAALRPPALKAIITICSTVDRYADDIHYKGGCLLNENLGWGANMLSYIARPPDPALVGDAWRDMWRERIEAMPFFPQIWLNHQARDDYWRRGSVCEDYGAIEAAVLTISGWHDGYRNTTAHLVENLSAPVKGIVGPWIHKYPHYAGPQPAIGFLQEAKRWWDRWLKGVDTGVQDDPAMRLWLMDSVRPDRWHDERPGHWIAEAEWPTSTIGAKVLHLGDGRLQDAPIEIAVPVASPQDCGLAGGEYFPFMFGPELPGDQREDDERSACFDGAALAEPLDLVGAPSIVLTLDADRPQANLCVRLCDVHPDGASELISYGLLNLSQRNSRSEPTPLQPGERVEVSVTLDQCAYRIPKGHHLRIAVSTAYWPVIWPSPEAATVTLHRGAVTLPVRPTAAGDEWRFETPEGAEPWKTTQIRPSSSYRHVERDEGGEVRVIVENDFGSLTDDDHGLINDSRMREVWTIDPDDPLSARAEIAWYQAGGRGDWSWRTEVQASMQSDAESFTMQARLTAHEGDRPFAQRDFNTVIPRFGL
ncbi:CocE/NonD family hydrolase [Paracoccus sp. TK19116]|uniref:CocE/NonD family hydrolase n=1 Tax=Paracoccus albicereus TaxID=2922394 RepID=A0ABT1MSY5_9RHOB|nr:CocE/NonD family hydrolase [Paracoccus albicereus]MCQ0971420.1 CocE/NonD family hydrolase [Paracoccus albicereus]